MQLSSCTFMLSVSLFIVHFTVHILCLSQVEQLKLSKALHNSKFKWVTALGFSTRFLGDSIAHFLNHRYSLIHWTIYKTNESPHLQAFIHFDFILLSLVKWQKLIPNPFWCSPFFVHLSYDTQHPIVTHPNLIKCHCFIRKCIQGNPVTWRLGLCMMS